MIMPIPNPRRSPPSSRNGRKTTTDGRKRQKLSHTPEDDASGSSTRLEMGNEVPLSTRVLASQDSGSSDQSASKWFNAAAHNATPAPKQNADIDGTYNARFVSRLC